MASSLPGMNESVKQWVNRVVRIDNWTLDMPSVLKTKKGSVYYPANTAVQFPPTAVEFEKTAFGLTCRAEFTFRIVYRVSSQLKFDEIPVNSACAVINNLYYDAVVNPAIISDSIVTLKTPADGIDLQINDPQEEGNDWLLFLNPQFYIEFKASRAADDFNPPLDIDPKVPITKLDIAIYRGDIDFDVTNSDTFNLDRLYHLEE
jgi:hypothetical protein